MMTHNEIKEQLFALYDGPLTEKERVLFEGHLSSCRECRQSIEEWERISGILFPAPAYSEAAEDAFVSQVMAKVQGLPQNRGSLSMENALRWLVPLLGSAAAAAWVFFSVLPNTPGMSSGIDADFSNDEPEIASSPWVAVPDNSPSGAIVQAFYREK